MDTLETVDTDLLDVIQDVNTDLGHLSDEVDTTTNDFNVRFDDLESENDSQN